MSARTAAEVLELLQTVKPPQSAVSSFVQVAVNANAARLGFACQVVESQLRMAPTFQRMQEQHEAATACARRQFEHALAELDAQIAADELAAARPVESTPDIGEVRACVRCGSTDDLPEAAIDGDIGWVDEPVCDVCFAAVMA